MAIFPLPPAPPFSFPMAILAIACLTIATLPPATSADADALLAFKSQLSTDSQLRLSGWGGNAANSPCVSNWTHVTCDNKGRVVALLLQDLNLTGPISAALAELRHLKQLNLSANQFTGSIPWQLSRLHSLTHLDLHHNNLTGPIPSELSLCTGLRLLDLSWNPLSGTIPSSFSSLHRLRMIQLHHIPLLTGAIPLPLLHLSNLTHLCLGSNNLTGTIPPQIGLLTKLQDLACYENPHIQGRIPTQISQLRSLRSLKLFSLNFSGSSIPAELGNLTSLQYLYLFNSGLSGSIPQELGNLANLKVLYAGSNKLAGTLPSSLGRLQSLVELNLYSNELEGALPSQLGNLSSLMKLYLQMNHFSHGLPPQLGNLLQLQELHIYSNSFSGPFPVELGRLSNLLHFYAFSNSFQGELPSQLGNLTQLLELVIGKNPLAASSIPSAFGAMQSLQVLTLNDLQLTGEIPSSLGNLSNIVHLRLTNNMLHGKLPPSLANCRKLQRLKLENNLLKGEIPAEYFASFTMLRTLSLYKNNLTGELSDKIGKLTNLAVLFMGRNRFEGEMPKSWANLRALRVLIVAYNNIRGEIPLWIWELEKLKVLDVSNNALTGGISPTTMHLIGFKLNVSKMVGGSETLWDDDASVTTKGIERWFSPNMLFVTTSLDLSRNKLQGSIPPELGELTALFNLNLSGNALHGNIPDSLGNLLKLESLDLSFNSLCDQIPQSLAAIKTLAVLNVSYNHLSGPIPQGGQFPFSNLSYLGNLDLCGEPLDLKCDALTQNISTCREIISTNLEKHHSKKWRQKMTFVACGVSVFTLSVIFLIFWLWRRYSKKGKDYKGLHIFDKDLIKMRVELLGILQKGYEQDNQIGTGGLSSVYKVILSNRRVVAVKRINLEVNEEVAKLSFNRETKILKQIRHRNVMKLLGIYSPPCKGTLSLACIFDFKCNGTLDDHLHCPNEATKPLNWDQRYKVAIGLAQGLCYLHNESGFGKILHLDLKPSNILMDDDMQPCISDFGSARMMGRNGQTSTTQSGFFGTIGYAAPECAHFYRVNEKVDVYSFGIILLEMVTGRRPIENKPFAISLPANQDTDLRSWVVESLSLKQNILDSALEGSNMSIPFPHQQALALVQIALSCTLQHPKERPSIQKALDMILDSGKLTT